jgi:excisionase family DNA binding protein
MAKYELTPPIWVRPREACRLMGAGMTRVYELLASGELESRKVGGLRLISVASIARLGESDTPAAA